MPMTPVKYLYIISVSLAFIMPCGMNTVDARVAQTPSLGREIQIPDEGLAFRGLRDARAVPLKPPEVFRYRTQDGRVLEMFDPADLWYPSQYLGRWEDPRGNVMVLGMVNAMMPDVFEREHVLRREFHQVFDGDRTPETTEEWVLWVENFTGVRVRGTPELLPRGLRLRRAVRFDLESTARPRHGYAFQFMPSALGVDDDQWYFVMFEFVLGTDYDAARRMLERDFLGSLQAMQRAGHTDRTASRRVQDASRTETGDDVSPEWEDSRKAAINSIRGMSGWWHLETPNYMLVSDLSGGKRSFVERVREDLEALREIWERMIPPRRAINAVGLVRVFSDDDDYVAYVGENYKWTGGIWLPNRRELVIRPHTHGRSRERREGTAGVINHEAFHQYLFYAFDAMSVSPWFNEGHAAFFEGAEMTGDGIRINEVERYASELESMAGGREGSFEARDLLKLSYDEFYDAREIHSGQRRQNYAMAWGLVYYLRKAAPLEDWNDHEKIPDRYADALWQTGNPDQATRTAFENVDMDEFNRNFKAVWDSKSRRTSALRHNPF